MQKHRRITMFVAAAFTLATLAGCGTPKPAGNQAASATNSAAATIPPEPLYTGPIVAKYTGGELTKEELDKQYNLQVVLPGLEQQETKKAFASYYIVWYKYLYAQAKQLKNVTMDTTQVQQMADQSIQQLVGNPYKTKDDVLAKMKSLGVTQDDVIRLAAKGEYLKQYLMDQLKGVQVTPQAEQDYYNQHKSDFIQVTVDHILVSSLDQAKQIEAQLKAGANFQQLADKYSTDPGVKQNHGTYADQLASSFVPEFAKAAETLPIGQISDPVKTQFGYHIMRVDKRTQLSFDQAKSDIDQKLLPQLQNDKEQSIYKNAQNAAKVQILVKDSDL